MQADDLSTVSLASLSGRRFVLYFYPQDDTPGRTTQACSLRDEFASLRSLAIETFGVSTDSVASHQEFRRKHSLPFRLLSDVNHLAAEAFGVWIQKGGTGPLQSMGTERTTFVVGSDRRIESVLAAVRPELHTAQLLGALQSRK
jgi:peroxiredoxin Q/BCP